MKKITTRVGLGISVFALGACLTSIALADAPKTDDQARPQCSGEHGGKRSEADRKQHAAERFKKADKNADGFLTQAEVGDKRWSRMQSRTPTRTARSPKRSSRKRTPTASWVTSTASARPEIESLLMVTRHGASHSAFGVRERRAARPSKGRNPACPEVRCWSVIAPHS